MSQIFTMERSFVVIHESKPAVVDILLTVDRTERDHKYFVDLRAQRGDWPFLPLAFAHTDPTMVVTFVTAHATAVAIARGLSLPDVVYVRQVLESFRDKLEMFVLALLTKDRAPQVLLTRDRDVAAMFERSPGTYRLEYTLFKESAGLRAVVVAHRNDKAKQYEFRGGDYHAIVRQLSDRLFADLVTGFFGSAKHDARTMVQAVLKLSFGNTTAELATVKA